MDQYDYTVGVYKRTYIDQKVKNLSSDQGIDREIPKGHANLNLGIELFGARDPRTLNWRSLWLSYYRLTFL
jgi:hypothetical protein